MQAINIPDSGNSLKIHLDSVYVYIRSATPLIDRARSKIR
jgi:hypothetical protein